MKFYALLFISIFSILSCNNSDRETKIMEENNKHNGNLIPEPQPATYEIKTFPAVNGLHTFVSEGEAKKVAELMVKKMQEGMTHPTISQEELKELQIEIK